jgi:hypothetical protein
VITSDPIDPDDAGVTSLYSKEYFELVRARLAPGGVACHWMPTQYSTEVYASLIEAFRSVFPSCWLFDADFTTVIVGRREDGPAATWQTLERAFADALVRASFSEIGVDSPADLLALRLSGPSGVSRLTAGRPPNSDDRPIAEYGGPRSIHGRTPESWTEKFRILNAGRKLDPEGLIDAIPSRELEEAESRHAAAGRAFEARLVLPLLSSDFLPAARALRRPCPRFVDVICGLARPEFAPDDDSSAFDVAFAAALDALGAKRRADAQTAFEAAAALHAGSPRSTLGLVVTSMERGDALGASHATATLAVLTPYLAPLASGLLKLQINRLIDDVGEPSRSAPSLARLRELLPFDAGQDAARWRTRWKAVHRGLRLDPASGRFLPLKNGAAAVAQPGDEEGR